MVRLDDIPVMLTYSFENIRSEFLYEHLYHCLREDIQYGKLRPGERLPSKRTFATHLGVSTITVENAYGQLLTEGYIYSRPKRGYYVADITSRVFSQPHSVQEPAPEQKKPPVWFADFTSNQIQTDMFPFATWSKVLRDTLASDVTSTGLGLSGSASGCFHSSAALPWHVYIASSDCHRSWY